MRKICLFMLNFCVFFKIFSQTYDILPTTLTVANASVADSKYYSAFQNPAISALQNGTQASIQYESRYIISALAKKSLQITTGNKQLNIGLSTTYTGYELQNELLTGFLVSKNFNNIFQLGIQYNYYSLYLAEANKRYAAFFPQVGLLVRVSSDLKIGFSTFNPGQQYIQLKYIKKQIPTIFSLGADWEISDKLDFLFQTDKNTSGSYRVAAGFEYIIKDFISVSTGAYRNEYLIPTIGCGLRLKAFKVHLNTELHPILGLTTCAAIQWSLTQK